VSAAFGGRQFFVDRATWDDVVEGAVSTSEDDLCGLGTFEVGEDLVLEFEGEGE
jgi:hypothetical protein